VATNRHHLQFDLSWRTIARILLVVLLVWLWFQLWQLVMVVLVSVVIAVALDPAVQWLEQRRVPRWLGSSMSVLLLLLIAATVIVIGWRTVASESNLILAHIQSIDKQFRSSSVLRYALPNPQDASSRLAQYAARFVASLFRAAMLVTIGLILTVYLLIEWKKTLDWVVAFFPKTQHPKLRATVAEARDTIFSYVVGNVLTSIFATCVVFAGLTLLHVPAALVLAILAGLFDFVPVLGFVLSGLPAVALAATVSLTAVVFVIALYIGYHLVENYFIAPRVYGGKLEMSNLAVLLAFAVGAELGGVIGALLALPIAATYPAIERIWLRESIGDDTVRQHERLAS
jgi:predicted PurR-regulated permease PerM